MDFITYRNLERGVRIDYPSNWQIVEDLMGSIVAFFTPLEDASDNYRENVNVVVQDLKDSPMTLEEYSEFSVNQLKEEINALKIIEPLSSATLSNFPAHKIVYNGVLEKIKLKYMQIWAIKSNIAYLVTYIAENNHFKDYINIIKQIVNSFEIL